MVKEPTGVKAYGAGILGGVGELEYCMTEKPKLHPLDLVEITTKHYDNIVVNDMQPYYFVAESFENAQELMNQYIDSMNKPFNVTFNEEDYSIEIDRKIRIFKHTPSAARWLPPYRKCHLLDSQSPAQMALRRLPYAGHLTSSGTAQACSTRISPARRPQTAQAHTASGPTFRTGRSGTLHRDWQWLQRPGRRTLKTQDSRSSSSPLRGDPGKHLLHRGFDKLLDSALASAEHHS